MNYVLIVEIDSILKNELIDNEFLKIYNFFKKKIEFVFLSRDKIKRENLENKLKKTDRNKYIGRYQLKNFIEERNNDNYFLLFFGNKDQTYFSAVYSKNIFINNATKNSEPKAKRYGIYANYIGLKIILKIILNNNNIFYKLDIDEKTTLISVIDPRTKGKYKKTDEENELIEQFQNILKNDSKDYINILMLLIDISIIKNHYLKKVDYWTAFPCSTGPCRPNMEKIEKNIKILMGQRILKEEKLFIRTNPKIPNHHKTTSDRIKCDSNFDSIILNEKYKDRLEDKTICVLDDYATHGTTSEVCRNLLSTQNIRKLYIFTLGKFNSNYREDYIKQDYTIAGDPFSKFSYQLKNKVGLNGETFENSKEIQNLYKIAIKKLF